MSTVAVIPARWASARFPGKPLVPLCGRPMIQWVHEAALATPRLRAVIIATDDERIRAACESFGAEVAMTSPDHPTGTDRLAEVAAGLSDDVIVNIQGDEPLLEPRLIDAMLDALSADPGAAMATVATPGDATRFEDPNCVKVMVDAAGRALYFSRAPIPAVAKGCRPPPYWQHVGLYAYRRESLLEFVEQPMGRLESIERLEQLRVLEAGGEVAVARVADWTGTAVDVPQDVARAEAALRARGYEGI